MAWAVHHPHKTDHMPCNLGRPFLYLNHNTGFEIILGQCHTKSDHRKRWSKIRSIYDKFFYINQVWIFGKVMFHRSLISVCFCHLTGMPSPNLLFGGILLIFKSTTCWQVSSPIDFPGVLSKLECSSFNLSTIFLNWNSFKDYYVHDLWNRKIKWCYY